MERTRLGWLFDFAFAVALTAVMVGGSIGEAHPTVHGTPHEIAWVRAHPPGAAYALVVLAGLVLAVRRRWPLTVLVTTVVAVSIYSGLGYVPGAALCAVYVALFTVGTFPLPRSVVVVAVVGSVVTLFLTAGLGGIFGLFGGTNTVMVVCCVAAVAIGMAVAGRRQMFVAMAERARRAELDREEETRRRLDAERLRIARELHDVVAHSMSMINVQAGVAAHVLATQPEQAAEALTAIRAASRDALRELRAILNVLRQVDAVEGEGRDPAPRLGQLDALAAAMTQAGLPTTVTVRGGGDGVSEAVELAVYRIVQESLTNVLRHAGPDARAEAVVEFGDGRVKVTVDDDGRGGPLLPSGGGSGMTGGSGMSGSSGMTGGSGIAGMTERTAAFGGRLSAGPRVGGGWRVEAEIPIEQAASLSP